MNMNVSNMNVSKKYIEMNMNVTKNLFFNEYVKKIKKCMDMNINI